MNPKAISVPPPLNTALSPGDVAEVKVTKARVVRDQWTSIGDLKLGLGLNVEWKDEEYSALFSMDKKILTGSIGRILVAIGMEDVSTDVKDEDFKELVGRNIKVHNKGGKLYWYP